METVKFADYQMLLNGVKGRTEINEIHPGKVSGSVQVLKKGMEQACNSILRPPLFLVCKLVWVQLWADDWEDGIQHQFLQALSDYGGECYWSVVISSEGRGFLGTGMMIDVFHRNGIWDRMDSEKRGKSTEASSMAQVLRSLPPIPSGPGALPDLHFLS